jgi:hypothetical protein
MRRTVILLACLLLAIGVGSASASTINITSITGFWQNPVGGLNTVVTSPLPSSSAVTWGDGILGHNSGYAFVAGPNITSVPEDISLFLGTFTHNNREIPNGSAITAVDLVFGFTSIGSVPDFVDATFTFNHNETTNFAGAGSANDDIVTIVQPIVNRIINKDGVDYYFNLRGFSTDGGLTFGTVFRSPEGGNTPVNLYGILTTEPIPPIPEPASLLLMGTGLVGMVTAARRRMRK